MYVCVLQDVKNMLAGEESQVELLKAQLKELFRFSVDSRHLSDDVLAVVKEHQRYVIHHTVQQQHQPAPCVLVGVGFVEIAEAIGL